MRCVKFKVVCQLLSGYVSCNCKELEIVFRGHTVNSCTQTNSHCVKQAVLYLCEPLSHVWQLGWLHQRFPPLKKAAILTSPLKATLQAITFFFIFFTVLSDATHDAIFFVVSLSLFKNQFIHLFYDELDFNILIPFIEI